MFFASDKVSARAGRNLYYLRIEAILLFKLLGFKCKIVEIVFIELKIKKGPSILTCPLNLNLSLLRLVREPSLS